jgi:hypothetical protein
MLVGDDRERSQSSNRRRAITSNEVHGKRSLKKVSVRFVRMAI